MALFGHIVLGPTVHQWRALDTSIRNIIPMLRRADAFNIEAAKSIDDTVASVYGIFPAPQPVAKCRVFVFVSLARQSCAPTTPWPLPCGGFSSHVAAVRPAGARKPHLAA